MLQHPVLQSLLGNPLVLILIASFAILMCFSIPAYFFVLRPKRNTTEWIARLERRHFQPLAICELHSADFFWALLTILCAAFLRFAYCFFLLGLHHSAEPLADLAGLLNNIIPAAILALALYLLLRVMFGKPLPAILGAILGGLSANTELYGVAFLALSLFFLYLWCCADYEASLFPNALWFFASAITYGLALVCSSALLWLLPFYFGVYLALQIVRWQNGDLYFRGRKLAGSVLLLLLISLLGMIAVWLTYCVKNGEGSPIDLLRSFDFYHKLFPGLAGKASALFERAPFWNNFYIGDVFVLISGILALIPLVHGAFKLRETRCLLLLLLLPCLLCAWLLSACYALVPLLILIIGWTWYIYAERNHSLLSACFAGMIVLFLFAERIIH